MSFDAPTVDFANRIRRAQEEMAAKGFDYLFVGPGSDLFYLTGINAHLSERLNLLVLPSAGTPTYVVPTLERPLVADRGHLMAIKAWEEVESPTALVAALVGADSTPTIGVSARLWSSFLLDLQERLSAAAWRPGAQVMDALRVSKDAYELALLRDVSRRADEAWEEFISTQAISGLTEKEALTQLRTCLKKHGLPGEGGLCASGPHSASPHHHTADRVIEPGDVVIFDFGGAIEGYRTDVTRTVVVGEPSDEIREIYDLVLRANQATLEAVKVGVPCEMLDRVARTIFTNAGYGPQFLHRVGHGIGLDVHEEPYLEGNTTPLAIGMCFSDEPGIYLEGRFGVRVEDVVICTADGGERLNHARRELTVLG